MCARTVILDHDSVQAVLSYEFSDLGVCEQLDVPGARNPVDEIPRHALAQVVAPYEQINPPRASRHVHRRLARRVAPAPPHRPPPPPPAAPPRLPPPYERTSPPRAPRQVPGRLARRVAPADDHRLLAFAPLGLGL